MFQRPSRRPRTASSRLPLRDIVRIVSALLLAGLTFACVEESPPAVDRVILITVDTLRADHLSAYGSQVSETPNMDRLAAEGLLFESAISPLPETRPSHFTMFTSRYPRDHGVMNNASTLDPEAVTLPALFAEAGYRTAGFAGCALFDEAMGAELGFEHFDAPEQPQRAAHEVVPRALEWLRSLGPEEPFFLWLHLFDPHMPYQPPPPFNRGAELAETWPEFAWPALLAEAEASDGDLPGDVFARAKELYAGEVEYADHWLGRFFESEELAPAWNQTLVLLTADHGECFAKGVFFDHSQCIDEGAIAVPMLLRSPHGVPRGESRAAPVEHLDIGPTLLRLAGLPVPDAFRGRGLLERTVAEADTPGFFQHPLYREIDIENRREVLRRLRSVAGEPTRDIVGDEVQMGARTREWKYVRRGAEETLYHLSVDPAEREDLSQQDPERLRKLRAAGRSWLRDHPVDPSELPEIPPEMVEKLQALGYL